MGKKLKPEKTKQSCRREYQIWKTKRRRSSRKPEKVKISIVSITEAGCSQGFKLGDQWILDANQTPSPPMCASVYDAIRQAIVSMRYGGELPWHKKNVTWFSCPDPNRQVIYEIRRLISK